MTDRDSIAAFLRSQGRDDLARRVETHEDRVRPEPTIRAEVWTKESNLR